MVKFNETFFNGAYYRVDVTPKLSVLAINSLYFGSTCNNSLVGDVPAQQMAWITEQLKETNRQFIMFYHIWPGLNYMKTGHPSHWYANYT